MACAANYRDPEVEAYLIEKQNEAVNAMKEAFADVAHAELGFPDLVIANVWMFAKPDLWIPGEDDETMERYEESFDIDD
jgi:hypothetical protein